MQTIRRGLFSLFTQFLDLIFFGGNVDLARTDEVTLDVEFFYRRFDAVEILVTELDEFGKFLLPTVLPILKRMRQRRGTETAVASARADGDLPRFQQNDITVRIGLLRLQSRP
jgi:hypothetical protein